jgi:hypothetical protein
VATPPQPEYPMDNNIDFTFNGYLTREQLEFVNEKGFIFFDSFPDSRSKERVEVSTTKTSIGKHRFRSDRGLEIRKPDTVRIISESTPRYPYLAAFDSAPGYFLPRTINTHQCLN